MRLIGVVWGSVPDWVGALGTTGALLAAVAVLALDLRRRREEIRHRERAQAELIAAWVETSSPTSSSTRTTYHVRIVNQSELPVYETMLRIEWPRKTPGHHWGVGVVAPGADISKPIDFDAYPDDVHYQYVRSGMHPLVSLGFIDAAGKPWRKYGDGKIEPGYWPVPQEPAGTDGKGNSA
jgi:hypothetical protein